MPPTTMHHPTRPALMAQGERMTDGGAIVNVSSGSAFMGSPMLYGMSKAALNSMQVCAVQCRRRCRCRCSPRANTPRDGRGGASV